MFSLEPYSSVLSYGRSKQNAEHVLMFNAGITIAELSTLYYPSINQRPYSEKMLPPLEHNRKMSSELIYSSVDKEMYGSRKNVVLIFNIFLGPVQFISTPNAE